MQRAISLFMFSVILIFAASTLFAQQVYFVQSAKAKVMSSPSFKAKLIAEVVKGYKLTSVGREGSWVRVKYGPNEGFVSALLLSSAPPLERQSLIKGEEAALQHNVRRRASTYTSAAAARGLAQEDRRRLSTREKSDYTSLDKIEAFTLGQDEVARFAEGGNP